MASRALSRLLGYFLLFVAFLLIAFGDFIFVNSYVRDLLIFPVLVFPLLRPGVYSEYPEDIPCLQYASRPDKKAVAELSVNTQAVYIYPKRTNRKPNNQ
jgi:hypothetical protein